MANHYRHEPTTRRDRAIEAILEWLTRVVEAWVAFWTATEPGEHAQGATERFGDLLDKIEPPEYHDHLTADSGRYALLGPDDVICGTDPEPVEMTAWTALDGHALAASLDQNGGAVL